MSPQALESAAQRAAQAVAFMRAAPCYWLTVFPAALRERRRWRGLAARIADPKLRQIAFDAHQKHLNLDGAAAFATLAPLRRRHAVVRALVAFHALYNHCDTLAEQPVDDEDPVARSRRLHQPLLQALGGGLEPPPAPAGCGPATHARAAPVEERWGAGALYVTELIQACRVALEQLPSWQSVAPRARRAANRIVAFQSLSAGPQAPLERWAKTLLPGGKELRWWELAAGAGSSLAVDALIAAAASSEADEDQLQAVESFYFPYVCALHSLLDSVADEQEDATSGQLSLAGCYHTPAEATARMASLAVSARHRAATLESARRHELIVVAMACSYLTSIAEKPQAHAVREAIGGPVGATVLALRARDAIARASTGRNATAASEEVRLVLETTAGKREIDASAL
ncbi:MAG TPA: DUF2600 family protein [Solirubrobacteraceae bacterium]|nr:DUF2600 family protein [Solirubrobacteraceae bacterium]